MHRLVAFPFRRRGSKRESHECMREEERSEKTSPSCGRSSTPLKRCSSSTCIAAYLHGTCGPRGPREHIDSGAPSFIRDAGLRQADTGREKDTTKSQAPSSSVIPSDAGPGSRKHVVASSTALPQADIAGKGENSTQHSSRSQQTCIISSAAPRRATGWKQLAASLDSWLDT